MNGREREGGGERGWEEEDWRVAFREKIRVKDDACETMVLVEGDALIYIVA